MELIGMSCTLMIIVVVLVAGHFYAQAHPEARFRDDDDDERY